MWPYGHSGIILARKKVTSHKTEDESTLAVEGVLGLHLVMRYIIAITPIYWLDPRKAQPISPIPTCQPASFIVLGVGQIKCTEWEEEVVPAGDLGYSGSTFFTTSDGKFLVTSLPRALEHEFFTQELFVHYVAHTERSSLKSPCEDHRCGILAGLMASVRLSYPSRRHR